MSLIVFFFENSAFFFLVCSSFFVCEKKKANTRKKTFEKKIIKWSKRFLNKKKQQLFLRVCQILGLKIHFRLSPNDGKLAFSVVGTWRTILNQSLSNPFLFDHVLFTHVVIYVYLASSMFLFHVWWKKIELNVILENTVMFLSVNSTKTFRSLFSFHFFF